MSLNNKKLAIILSIIAVIVVVYQVFIRKPSTGIQTPVSQQPAFSPSPRVQPPPASSGTGQPNPTAAARSEKNSESLTVDYNSTLLLDRVNPETAFPYPKQELPREFGIDIFSLGSAVEENVPQAPQYERELKFKLSAILIGSNRRIAVINDKILKIGGIIQGAEVISIEKNKVVLRINKEEIVLSTLSQIKIVRIVGGKGE